MEVAELLTIKDVCKILNVSDDTVRKEVKEMKLAGTKIRRDWRFTQEAVEDYFKSRTIKTKKSA